MIMSKWHGLAHHEPGWKWIKIQPDSFYGESKNLQSD